MNLKNAGAKPNSLHKVHIMFLSDGKI